jgi:dienelactone hydrolase
MGGPYPAITFGHGFFQTPDRYQGTLEHLATWGYVTIAPASHAGLSPDHAAFAADLRQSLDWLVAQSADASAWLAGMVDPAALGASGHSMGAGASLLAAADNPAIRAVANLAAAETRPPAAEVLPTVMAPVALIVGDSDKIVPPESTAALYDAAGPPRQFLVLEGGTHCGFQDDPFPIACDGGRNEAQLASTRRLLTAFFELYLRWDGQWTEWVWGPSPYDGEVAAARVDPGVTLLPADNLALVPAGGAARVPLNVTNTGRAGAWFALTVTTSDWPAELSVSTTPELAPGATFECVVTVHRPAGMPPPANPLSYAVRATAPDGLTATFASILADARALNPIRLALPWLKR